MRAIDGKNARPESIFSGYNTFLASTALDKDVTPGTATNIMSIEENQSKLPLDAVDAMEEMSLINNEAFIRPYAIISAESTPAHGISFASSSPSEKLASFPCPVSFGVTAKIMGEPSPTLDGYKSTIAHRRSAFHKFSISPAQSPLHLQGVYQSDKPVF